jgi:peptide/nickel transport system permease protein
MAKILNMIAQRVGLGILVLVVVSLIIYLGIELLPGDIAQEILGSTANPETVAAFRRELGLDLPPHTRYFQWLGDILQGDFVSSLDNSAETSELIRLRFENTLFLAALAAFISIPLALIFGFLAALLRNSFYDRAVGVVSLAAVSAPEFLVAYILILFFAVNLDWLPRLSVVDADADFTERVYRAMLPALTLTGVMLAYMVRMVRETFVELLASDYIEMARLKGMTRTRLILSHVLPNAWAPIVNTAATGLAYLVFGAVVVEVVFEYPGLGQLIVDSVSNRDIPVVQACCLIFAAIHILLILTADLVSIVADPKLLHSK